MSGASPGALWSRSDLRARAVSLVVLGVLVGLTIGLATAAYDGARRTDSALSRLQSRTNASDAIVFATQAALTTADWSKLEKRPEVEQLVRWGLAFGDIPGDPEGVLFVPMDDAWLNKVDRPIIVAGRMFDPKAADEVIVSDDVHTFPDGTPMKLGATVSFTPFVLGSNFDAPPSGPKLTLRVVGIVHTPLTYVFSGNMFLSPGFVTKYGKEIYIAENAVIKLRHPATDIGALRRDASSDVAPDVPVLDFHVTGRRVTATTDVEGAMLRLLAAIIALAGVAFVGQALARSAATVSTDAPALRAMGMTHRELVIAALRPHLVTAGIAVVTATLTAVIASRWFPVGLAGGVDPDRGIRINIARLTLAALLAALITLGVAALGGWKAARPPTARMSRHGMWLAHMPIAQPVVARLGTRMAFEGAGSKRRSSAWPALLGAAAAVTGVVAIVTVNHGLADAVGHPQVAGVAWDASVQPLQSDISLTGVKPALVDDVAKQPGVAAVSAIARYVSKIGDLGVPLFTVIDRAAGPSVHLVTLSGRAPVRDDEVVLGPSTAHDLGVKTGDTVNLADGRSARVVGLGLFPSDVHAQFDEGAWVSPKRWSGLAAQNYNPENNVTVDMVVAVRFTDRDHLDQKIDALANTFGSTVQSVDPAEKPLELVNLHNVRTLPTVLAIFLAVLGAVAVGHALFSSVYRRRRDFAVLQSLGVTRTGVRGMITAQATVVGLAGLLIGVPLGLIAGRAGWQAIANRVPLTFRSPLTVIAVLVVVPVALIAANLLAIIPARRASKAKPALVLRSE